MATATRSPRVPLQDVLERLGPGDEIHVTAISHETGLDATTCQSVLEALVRVDLFTRMDDRVFVRRRMFDALDRLRDGTVADNGRVDPVSPRPGARRASRHGIYCHDR
jgi:hypothetical protein